MMRLSHRRIAAFVLGVGLSGCGGSAPPVAPIAPSSHRGQVEPIPGRPASVEVVVEPDQARAAGRKASGKVVAYFSNADGSGPADPAPKGVAFTDPSGKVYLMTPHPEGAARAVRFDSEAGPFPPGREVSGVLTATISGERVEVMIRGR